MARFPGVDYMYFDSLLSEQELLVRQTARQFVDDRVIPVIRDAYNNACLPKHLIGEMGELGFFGANLEGYGCAGMNNIEYGLLMQEIERGDSGLAQFRERAGRAGDVSDPRLRHGRTKATLAAETAIGQSHRLFWTDRAGFWIESFRHAHDGREARRPMGSERREDLDHQWHAGGCGDRLGAHAGRGSKAFWWRRARRAFKRRIFMESYPCGLPLPRVCTWPIARCRKKTCCRKPRD